MRYRIITALAVLIALTLGLFCYSYPIYPALICPGCYGFEKVEDNFYVQSGLTEQQRKEIIGHYEVAQIRVSAVLGPLRGRPVIFACTKEKKFQHLGGSKARWQALGHTALYFSPRGLNPSAMGHTLSHIELKLKMGSTDSYSAVPAWFEEGLAVLVSKDARYTGEPKDDEMPELEVQTLKTGFQWNNAITENKNIYAPSYRIVKRWFDKAGQPGVTELINRIKKGEAFTKVYAELGDRP